MSDYAPNVNNYQIGKGVLYFNRYDSEWNLTGELDLGNDPAFSLSPSIENIEHFSSREGLKRKDYIGVIQASVSGKFTLDEINYDNLALIFMGKSVEYLTQANGAVINEEITAHLGRYIKLNYRKIKTGSVVVTNNNGTITYNLNTDYTVDYTTGRLYIVRTGTIAENEILKVDYDYEACSYPIININSNTTVTGLLRFVGNCTLGYNYEIVLWKVKLSPAGDINFIGDNWNQLEFNFEGLDDSINHPSSPFGQIIDIEGDTVSGS